MLHRCSRCNGVVEEPRWRAGINTCLPCGDAYARSEIADMRGRVYQTHNKGGFSIASKEAYQKTMLDAGRKDTALVFDHVTIVAAKDGSRVNNKRRRRPIGSMWLDGDCVAIFDRDDPRIQRASRFVFYGDR